MHLMDEQFGAFNYIVIGFLAGRAGEAIVFYPAMGIAIGAENFYGYQGDIYLDGLEFFFGSCNGIEGILQEQGFHIGQQANF